MIVLKEHSIVLHCPYNIHGLEWTGFKALIQILLHMLIVIHCSISALF